MAEVRWVVDDGVLAGERARKPRRVGQQIPGLATLGPRRVACPNRICVPFLPSARSAKTRSRLDPSRPAGRIARGENDHPGGEGHETEADQYVTVKESPFAGIPSVRIGFAGSILPYYLRFGMTRTRRRAMPPVGHRLQKVGVLSRLALCFAQCGNAAARRPYRTGVNKREGS